MRQTEDTIEVSVGRFNEATQKVTVDEGATVADVLDELDIEVAGTETLWVDGIEAKMKDVVEDGDRISIVAKKEGGLN